MVGHGGSSAGSYLADPTSPIPSHCASIVVTSTVRVNGHVTPNMKLNSSSVMALSLHGQKMPCFIHPFIHSNIHKFTYLPSTCLPVCLCMYLSVHLSIHLLACSFITAHISQVSAINLSILQFDQSINHLFVFSFIYSFI